MRKHLLTGAILTAAILLSSNAAMAQRPESKVIDTTNLVVKPVDTTTGIIGGTAKYISKQVAGFVDNNAMVRTVNNLFGTKAQPAKTQAGLSPLPDPSSYPSGYFKSPLSQAPIQYQTFKK